MKKIVGTTTTRYLSSLYFYYGDYLGSTSVVTDVNGNNFQALTYYPFGQTRANIPSTPVNDAHKYTGQELDHSTGCYDCYARLYDPVLGRFVTADMLGPDPLNPQDFNRYSSVRNNPLKYIDPSGHEGACPARSSDPNCDMPQITMSAVTVTANRPPAPPPAGDLDVRDRPVGPSYPSWLERVGILRAARERWQCGDQRHSGPLRRGRVLRLGGDPDLGGDWEGRA